MDNKTEIYRNLVVLAMVSLLSTFLLIASNHRWKERKRIAVAIPTKSEFSYPMIPYLAMWDHPDAPKLYTFIESYIHWTVEETLDQYEKQSSSDTARIAYLKNKFQYALWASDGPENARITEKYVNSPAIYAGLAQCDCGINFNIAAIESVQATPKTGVIYVTVLGGFQASYNGIVKPKPDARMAGYHRLHFMVIQGLPTRGKDNNFVNKYGMYVVRMWDEPVSKDVIDDLFKKSFTAGLGYGDISDFDLNKTKKGKK